MNPAVKASTRVKFSVTLHTEDFVVEMLSNIFTEFKPVGMEVFIQDDCNNASNATTINSIVDLNELFEYPKYSAYTFHDEESRNQVLEEYEWIVKSNHGINDEDLIPIIHSKYEYV